MVAEASEELCRTSVPAARARSTQVGLLGTLHGQVHTDGRRSQARICFAWRK